MFLRQQNRRHKAEQIAGQAWDHLTAAIDSAGSSVRSYPHTVRKRAADTYVDASDRMELGAREARRRANNAFEALLGRQPPRPWGLLAVTALGGAALGWLAAVTARQLSERRGVFDARAASLEERLAEDAWLNSTLGTDAGPQT